MDIDDEFVQRFKEQIRSLENMKQAVQDAIERAEGRLKRIEAGESVDEVFSPDKGPANQGGGG
jgi:predicted component of type VI protein secretion system